MDEDGKEIRVRFAPSPTGPFHIGSARTVLFNWLFARKYGGKFILRIENTDKERSEKKWEDMLIDGIGWLGLAWDEGPVAKSDEYLGKYGPYRQSERTEVYRKHLEKLLAEGKAYYCYCTKEDLDAERQAMSAQGLPPKYSGHCRNVESPPSPSAPSVIRFKTPEAKVEFKDIIRGAVLFDASLFGDIVIAKDIDTPLYNFAAVVDDEEMKISHVIRGEDHISNTPKQVLLQKALEFREMKYAHLPLILGKDKSKLSKRFAETSLLDYETRGYLPEAMVNFLALLGWHSREEKEVFSLEELVKEFDLKRVQKAGAMFNGEKLDWLQREHIKMLPDEEIAERLKPLIKNRDVKISDEILKKIIGAEKSRMGPLSEFMPLANFFFKLPDYGLDLLTRDGEYLQKIGEVIPQSLDAIENIPDQEFSGGKVLAALSFLINKEGRGAVLWPLRVALSGQRVSPDPLEIMEILGKEESLRRIKIAKDKIPKSVK